MNELRGGAYRQARPGHHTGMGRAAVSLARRTATGGIDQQTLGSGVINTFTYDETSNRLDRILTAKPGYLALVDLSYDYDLAGNITTIDDGVRQEERTYQYDFLDRLTYAGVYAGPQMIEERYYTYDPIGNLMSFRHRYPSAGQGRGAWAVGGSASADGKALRGSFNGLSSSSMSSGQQQGNHSGSAMMPYVYGFGGDAPDGGYNGRGSLASGANGEGTSYQGAGSFNPMTGASESSGFDGRGVLAFTRGIEGGFGGWEGNEYTGPYGESTIDYTYPDNHVRPHAVTARSNGDTFTYDANGNMTSRTQEGITWTQVFDAENRLVSVSNNATPSTTTTYVYDGSGGRLKRIVNDGSAITTTLYMAGMEIETVGAQTKRTVYYPSGGAFRILDGENAGLYYRHGDHLGSTSVLSDASGMKVSGSDVVYAPFGEVRSGTQSTLTDFGYTGQRKDDSTGGLMYYGARYYLPGIQHFVSADTVVPLPIDPQNFNRYSYTLNNPIRFSDPTGHIVCEGTGVCKPPKPPKPPKSPTSPPPTTPNDPTPHTPQPPEDAGGVAPGPPTPTETLEEQLRNNIVFWLKYGQKLGAEQWKTEVCWDDCPPTKNGTECVAFLSWVLWKAGIPMDPPLGDTGGYDEEQANEDWYFTPGEGWSTPTTSVEASFPYWTGGQDFPGDRETTAFPSSHGGTPYEPTDFAGNLEPGDFVYAAHNAGKDDAGNDIVDWDHVMMVVDVDKSGNIWLGDLSNPRFLYDGIHATGQNGVMREADRFMGIHMPY